MAPNNTNNNYPTTTPTPTPTPTPNTHTLQVHVAAKMFALVTVYDYPAFKSPHTEQCIVVDLKTHVAQYLSDVT